MGEVVGTSSQSNVPAVSGSNTAGGLAAQFDGGVAVTGVITSTGGAVLSNVLLATQTISPATINAANDGGDGVLGNSNTGNGIHGVAGAGSGTTLPAGCGVVGESASGCGVFGASNGSAVMGQSANGRGIHGLSGTPSGKLPTGPSGVFGESQSANGFGVFGLSTNGIAGFFDGDVTVTRNQTVKGNVAVTGNHTVQGHVTATDVRLSGMDCAEDFDLSPAATIEPGTVVVLGERGTISASTEAYDKRVAGVISGAGNYRPGIVLGRHGSATEGKAPVALVGRVYCRVDASYAPVDIGDLLTTSPTPGHAMKASEPGKSYGAVIGKSLGRLIDGRGLVPVLVALQ